jgi:hypothetical protein
LLAAPLWINLLIAGGPPDLTWTRSRYLDQRWLLALYWLSVGAVLALPWLFSMVHRVAIAAPATARGLVAALRGLTAGPVPGDPGVKVSSVRSSVLRTAAGLLLATVMFGPPWHTDRVGRAINLHETIHWSGLQAIERGYAPYLGPASVNYGPGLQLLTYAYMTTGDRFSVPGHRATFGLSLWIAGAMVLALAFALFRPAAALLVAALLPVLSPAAMWTWGADGTLRGLWGWANVLRMIAGPVLALVAIAVVGQRPGRRADLGRGLALGLLWGLFSYLAQENLVAGGATLVLLSILLLSTGTLPFDRLARLGAGAAGGFAAAWAPALVYYDRLGRLGELWYNYTLVPRLFFRGYANTPYAGVLGEDPWVVAFHVMPFLTVLLAVSVLVRTRPVRFAAPLDRDRLLVLAPCIALLTSYPSALMRSDAPHLLASLFALPLMMAAALFHLPRCLATPASRWRARLGVVALAGLVFWPIWLPAPERLVAFAAGRAHSLTAAPRTPWVPEDEIARRFGRALCGNAGHLPHLELMRRVKAVVGEGRVFVQVSERATRTIDQTLYYSGGLYFLADLNPGPIWLERSDLVANDDQIHRFRRHFRKHIDRFDFVVSLVPASGEILIFQEANPDFTTAEVAVGDVRVWIYGRGGSGRAPAGGSSRRSGFSAATRYWAPRGTPLSRCSNHPQGLPVHGNSSRYLRSRTARPAPASSLWTSRAPSSAASASNSHRETAHRVRGFSGLCSTTMASPPARTTRAISASKPGRF